MNKTLLWVILAVSAVLFLYPSVTTLIDVLEASGGATGPALVARDRVIMQVLGFVSLYAFLGFLLYSYEVQPRKRSRMDDYEDTSPHFSITLDPWYSVAIGALATLGAIALQYFAGLIDTSQVVSGIATPLAIAIIAGLIIGLIAFMIIDKLNEDEE